jgi:hypothetical protein
MKQVMKYVFIGCYLLLSTLKVFAKEPVKQYVFFSKDRDAIHEMSFFANPAFEGAQITYAWKQLEHGKGGYDFKMIREDLNFLTAQGKKLFIQLQDVTFDSAYIAVPAYLLTDSIYHGGIAAQYNFAGEHEEKPRNAGWGSRRWDKAVAERFHALIEALGKAFDGKIEGINLQETAAEYGSSGKFFPAGFTPECYRDAVKENMLTLRKAFPKSVAIQYANFMPGEWRPDSDKHYLSDLYAYAKQIGIGMGGPDVLVNKKGQMDNSYELIRSIAAGHIPIAMAVQQGNYNIVNARTEKQVTVPEIYDFAKNYLKADYIFWYREEPFYTREVLPYLKSLKNR